MDGKLARGLAREGMRNTKRQAAQMLGFAGDAWGKHLEVIGQGGKATMSLTAETIAASKRFTTNPMFAVDLASDRRASPRMVGAVNCEFLLADGFVHGHPEQALFYQMTMLAGSRKTLEHRCKFGGVVLRQHALKRCIERADKTFSNLCAELSPSILLTTALRDLDSWASRPIVVPVPSGLYLGLLRANPSDQGLAFQGACIDATIVENEWVLEPHPTLIELTTFISHAEMFDEQAAIWKALMDLLKEHSSALLYWHISDLVTLGGKADVFDFAKSAHDLAPLRNGLRRIVGSKTWRRAVRYPAGHRTVPSWRLLQRFDCHFPEGTSRHAHLSATKDSNGSTSISAQDVAIWSLEPTP